MSRSPTRVELAELDIDCRLLELWAEASAMTHWEMESVLVFARAAYAQGYIDALQEKKRGSLLLDNGYALPEGA